MKYETTIATSRRRIHTSVYSKGTHRSGLGRYGQGRVAKEAL